MEMTFTDTTEKKSWKYFGVIIFLIVLLGGIVFGYQYFFGHKQGEILEKNFSENPETFNQDVAKEFTEPIGVFQEHTADGKEIAWGYSFSSAEKRRLAEWTGRGSVRPILQDGKLMYLDYGETCNTFTCAQLMIVDLRHELSPSRIASSVSSFFFSPDRSYVLYVTYSNEGTSVYRHNISLGENDLIYEVAGNRDIDLLGSSADNSFIIFREGNTLYRAKNGEAEVLFEPLQREWEDYYYQLSNDGAKALVIRDIAPPSGNGAHIFLYSLFDVYKKEIKTLENVPQSYSYGFTEDSEDMYALENRAEWRDINNPTFSSTYWIYDPQTADYEKIFSSIRGEILLPPLDEEHFLISRLRVLDDSGRRSTTFFLEPPSFGSNQLVIETAKYELVPFLGWLEN